MNNVILELVRESLIAVVNEMRANMIYASYSSVIFEGHDFSCALLTANGKQIAQGLADHPIHIFAVPASAAEVLRLFDGDINPGDVFLHNDPYTGGTHLNDMLMLYPIFHRDRLVTFAAVRAHWNDVGGMTPGSLSGGVKEILQEGVRVPPIKICEQGRVNRTAATLLFSNMRVESERRGDFECMLGTCRKAEEHVKRLCDRFGLDAFMSSMEELIENAALRMRKAIEVLPDGTYRAEGFIESDGHTLDPRPIRVALTIDGDRMHVDFTGSAPQVAGPTNAGIAMAANSAFTIAKAFLDPSTPINHGSFEPVEVVAPLGTIVNAHAPAPCGGMAEVKYAIDSVVASALGQALPEQRTGDTKGTANHVHITSASGALGEPKILYEWPAGGTGATARQDGFNVMRNFAEGDFNSIHAIEVVESAYPLRVKRSEIRTGSCGDGKHRGGFGLLREIEVAAPTGWLSVLSDRNVIPPYGVNGGGAGAPNRFTVVRGNEEIMPSTIPGKVSGFPLRKGDLVRIRTAGGGGWGEALERDPQLVAEDVRQGYLTADQARQRFGVVLGEDGTVQAAETAAERERIARERVHVSVEVDAAMASETGRRLAGLSPATCERLGLGEGDLIELVNPAAPTIRAWVRINDQADESVIVEADIAAMLGEKSITVQVRPLNASHA